MYTVYQSENFKKELASFAQEFHHWVGHIENQLLLNPYVGKPLGKKWFREKKHGKYRIYYLIYEEVHIVYFIAISEKKDQEKVIKTIISLLEQYKNEIKTISLWLYDLL